MAACAASRLDHFLLLTHGKAIRNGLSGPLDLPGTSRADRAQGDLQCISEADCSWLSSSSFFSSLCFEHHLLLDEVRRAFLRIGRSASAGDMGSPKSMCALVSRMSVTPAEGRR